MKHLVVLVCVLGLSACVSENEVATVKEKQSIVTPTQSSSLFPEFREASTDTDFAFLDAAEKGDFTILEHIDTPYVTTRFYGESALHLAVRGGHSAFISKISSKFNYLNYVTDRYGLTPLMLALDLQCDSSVVAPLLMANISLNMKDLKDSWNAFHYGVIANDETVMQLLMEADERIHEYFDPPRARVPAVYGTMDRFGRTPFQFAVQFNCGHSLRAIVNSRTSVEKSVIPPALRTASESNFTKITELLLPHATPELCNTSDSKGRTALMLAAPHHDTRIVHQLLHAGASFLIKDKQGNMALHYAVRNSSMVNVRQLLDAGAPLEAVNADSETAFLLAAAEGFTDLAEFLLQHKSDLNVTDSQGRTPLIRAAMGRHTDTVELLVKSGANIDNVDANGMNAAMVAVENLNTEIARLLLRQGINVNQCDKRGRYLRDIAVQAGNDAVIRMIDNAQY